MGYNRVIMKDIEHILQRFPQVNRDVLIPVLQAVQDEYGYLSEDSVRMIGEHLGLPTSKIYGLATFYNQFTFSARGKFHIQVCDGSSCHLEKNGDLLKELYKQLGIRNGQTTRDGMFSLEVLACIGACGQAPVMVINGDYYARVTPSGIREILEDCKNKAG